MTLFLLSGRPGAGKTAFGRWLAAQRGFVHVETDGEGSKWGPLVCVQSLEATVATSNLARALGPNVVIEWGFRSRCLAAFASFGLQGSMPGGSTAKKQRLARATSAGEVTLRV